MRWTVVTFFLLLAVSAPTAGTEAVGGVEPSVTAAEPAVMGVEPAPSPSMADSVEPTSAVQRANGTRVTYFSLAGRGLVTGQEELVADHPGPPYVWASEALELRTTVETDSTERARRACARLLDDDGAVRNTVGCDVWDSTTRHRWSRVTLSAWPAGTSGNQTIRIDLKARVRNGSATGDGGGAEWVRRDAHEVDVYVISKQGDLDDDGLSNAREVEVGTDFTRADTDGDGLSDRAELFEYDSDPLAADSTGDGIEDGTVAGLGLPPTVPYVVHGVATLTVLATGTLVVAGVKLRRALRARSAGGGYSAADTAAGGRALPRDDWAPQTKEDEIVAVLREHGGRMRQADLVDETEWSKATVSRLLSTLEDEDRVEKIRVGRGNVVRLTGPDPPLDDERTRASG